MSVTVASLQTRCDGGQFALLQEGNTKLVKGRRFVTVFGQGTFAQLEHPDQPRAPHASASRTAISWTAVYRTRRLSGFVLVVDSAVAGQYVQTVLDHADATLSLYDMQALAPQGFVAGLPTFSPTGH